MAEICPKCGGTGKIMIPTHDVGIYERSFCGNCNGIGRVRPPGYRWLSLEELPNELQKQLLDESGKSLVIDALAGIVTFLAYEGCFSNDDNILETLSRASEIGKQMEGYGWLVRY